MELTIEEIKIIIETFQELSEELSENKHGTLVMEQWDLMHKLQKHLKNE